MRLVGCFIMFICLFIGCGGFWLLVRLLECMSIPGMSGMGGCFVCAWREAQRQ